MFPLEIGDQHLDVARVRFGLRFIAALIARRVAGFTAVEMALSAFSAKEFSRRGDLESLRDRLLRLLLHK